LFKKIQIYSIVLKLAEKEGKYYCGGNTLLRWAKKGRKFPYKWTEKEEGKIL